MAEKPIYEEKIVRVTRTSLVVGSQTYEIRAITSVTTQMKKANRIWAVVLIGAGALVLIGGLSGDETPRVVVGAIIGGLGGLWYRSITDKYSVVVTTASGETVAFLSDDARWVDRVAAAVKKALVARG